jgi:hypothetical protein
MNTELVPHNVVKLNTVQAKSFHARVRDHATRVIANSEQRRELARELFDLSSEYASFAELESEYSFLRWYELQFAVPQSTTYDLLTLGTALQMKLETIETPVNRSSEHSPMRPATDTELRSAVKAMRNGATESETRKALQAGTVHDFARAKANDGMTILHLTLAAKTRLDSAVATMREVYASNTQGETIEAPEALDYITQFLERYCTAHTLLEFLRNEGGEA